MSASLAEVIWYNEDSASPLTVTKPGSFASGQVLVAIMVQHGPTGSATAMTAPSGWTQQGADLAGTNSQGRVFSHVFSGGDPSTWDFPYSPSADICLMLCRITGADTGTLTIVVGNTNTTSLTSSYDSPSITPTGTDDLLICTISDISNGNTFSVTAPSGMTSQGTTQIAGGFMAEGGASLQLSSGSATGAKTWTSVSPTGADGGSFSVAIKSTSSQAPTLPLGLIRRILIKPPFPPRRSDLATPVRAQVNPPIPLQPIAHPRRVGGLPRWHTRFALTPMVGATPPSNPPLPPPFTRRRVNPLPRPARTRLALIPSAVGPVPEPVRRPGRRLPLLHRALVRPAPVNPETPPGRGRLRARPPLCARRQQARLVPDQVIVPPPPIWPGQALTRHRPLLWPRHRGASFAAPASVSVAPDPGATVYSIGQPRSRWHTGEPYDRWQLGTPRSRWNVGTPQGEA